MRKGKKGPKQGWYILQYPAKFKVPVDRFMNSFKILEYRGVERSAVQYKSGLELRMIKYCDLNPKVIEWSLEPFHIPYVSPIDSKTHRYFPDVWMKFSNNNSFLVEVKSHQETQYPNKKDKYFGDKLKTYLINQAKWSAAVKFCQQKNLNFKILTEKILK